MAVRVWSHFMNLLRTPFNPNDPIEDIFSSFFTLTAGQNAGCKEIRAFIFHAIIWHLWKNGNCSRFQQNRTFALSIIIAIESLTKCRFHFQKLPRGAAHLNHALQLHMRAQVSTAISLKWNLPPHSTFKLNTDGCSKGNPGPAGAGSILRSHTGDVIWMKFNYLQHRTCTKAEFAAVLLGLQQCISTGHHNIILEVDSMTVHNALQSITAIPWSCRVLVSQIKVLLQQLNYTVQHCYREVNIAADYLSNMAVHSRGDGVLTDRFPLALKGITRLDKLGLPYIIVSTK